MGVFKSSFFSLSGQKERLANVGKTLVASVTGKGVKADTGSKTADKLLSTAASHPFATAGVIAGGAIVARGAISTVNVATGARVAGPTVQALQKGATAIGQAGKSLATAAIKSPVKATGVLAAGALGGTILAESPKARQLVTQAPANIKEVGKDIAAIIENPSAQAVFDFAKEHPIATGIAGAAAAIGLGKALPGGFGTGFVLGKIAGDDKAQAAPSPGSAALTAAPAATTKKAADVVAETPKIAPTPDKKVTTKKARRRKKRKVFKCHRHKDISGRFNLQLS